MQSIHTLYLGIIVAVAYCCHQRPVLLHHCLAQLCCLTQLPQNNTAQSSQQFVVTKAPILVGSTKSLLRRLAVLSRSRSQREREGRSGTPEGATSEDTLLISEVCGCVQLCAMRVYGCV